jgi:hypothetical protein
MGKPCRNATLFARAMQKILIKEILPEMVSQRFLPVFVYLA